MPEKELQERVAEAIRPIVLRTYGSGSMPKALVDHLAEKIAAWPNTKPLYGAETREEMVLHTCWNWFSGGTTAESVAAKIEAALKEPSE